MRIVPSFVPPLSTCLVLTDRILIAPRYQNTRSSGTLASTLHFVYNDHVYDIKILREYKMCWSQSTGVTVILNPIKTYTYTTPKLIESNNYLTVAGVWFFANLFTSSVFELFKHYRRNAAKYEDHRRRRRRSART